MFIFKGTIRKNPGKAESRRLRHQQRIPAVVYGQKKTPLSIELGHYELLHAQEKSSFYEEILTLCIQDETGHEMEHKVRVKAIQRHPFKPSLMHVDFTYIEA